jgi:peptide/nickel transport system substrate-binding protein
MIVPALVAVNTFGYDPTLAPYAFDPGKVRALLREAGYPDGLAVTLIAPPSLEVQATVVGKMLELAGFTVERQTLDPAVYNRKTRLTELDQPAEQQAWDIALTSWADALNFPAIQPYHIFALDGPSDWVLEEPELQRLYAQLLRTVDREHQQALIRQMERHTRDQAYFLFLYNPIKLYAVNKAVEFVPYVSTSLNLAETSVTEQHWSVRKQGAAVQE